MKMKTMRSSILCFVVLLLSAPLLRAQDRREPANGSARRQAERQYVCLAIFLELAGVNPSAVYVSGKHSQKRSAKHGDHGCNEHPPVAAYARGAYQESASQSAANTHENVHNRAVTITLKNSSCAPAHNRSDQNPCESIHTLLLA